MFRVDLRRLILWISLLSVAVVLAGGLHASYLVQRDLLLRNALEVNRVYASKLALTTDSLLGDIRHYLSYSADILADMESHPELMTAETRRLEEQLGHFNSTFVASPQGKVLAVSTSYPQLLGHQLVSEAVKEALASRRPTISEPFKASNGRWQILYTQPIFSRGYRYLGFIAGSLYLHEDNVLDRLLGQHFYRDDSILYVIDRKGTLIYHPDRGRLGKTAPDNAVTASARRGEAGGIRFVDSEGHEMLAGYAPVSSTGWSIIAQRPVDSTLQPLGELLMATASNTLPLLLISVALIWLLSRWIARPLGQMAGIAKRMQDPDSADRIRDVRSWYFEAAQLKRALLMGLASIHHTLIDLRRDSTTDTLTGLLNRRGMDEALALVEAEGVPVAIVAVDIDHFKRINDRYGHAAGDQALQALADVMRDGSRSGDVLARTGGEEFVMLLPGAGMTAAIAIAQRLRARLASRKAAPLPTPITISAGVAHHPEHGATLEATLQRADRALYYAKNHGRDTVCAADDAAQDGFRLDPAP